ncbi:hypothetical protein MOQ11_20520, partial [Stenotrophomonas maltophilia]|uniref:hypothetical protein n=1 Tax=Stenotrophomonas maltophilia TaxID=40324 RepID=UPI001F535828
EGNYFKGVKNRMLITTMYQKGKRKKNKEHTNFYVEPFREKTTSRGEDNSLCRIQMITRGVDYVYL